MASKIRDGLFISDAVASKDREFIRLNKIHAIVNVAGNELVNYFEPPAHAKSHGESYSPSPGVHTAAYMTLSWVDDGDFIVFGTDDSELISMCHFIGT
jgi:hypothetical protein